MLNGTKYLFLGWLGFFCFGVSAKDYNIDELKKNVDTAALEARARIKAYENKASSLWQINIQNMTSSAKKNLEKKLKDANLIKERESLDGVVAEISRVLPFTIYLDRINELKVKAATKGPELKKIIDNCKCNDDPKKLHDLNMKISEDLRAFASYIKGPLDLIQRYTDILKEIQKVKK